MKSISLENQVDSQWGQINYERAYLSDTCNVPTFSKNYHVVHSNIRIKKYKDFIWKAISELILTHCFVGYLCQIQREASLKCRFLKLAHYYIWCESEFQIFFMMP